MKQTDPQMKIRLPEALKEQIESVAKANNRSMNAEIVARLSRSFEGDKLGLSVDMLDAIAMQSALIVSLYQIIDHKKLTAHELQMFEAVVRFSRRITDNTLLTELGEHNAIVGRIEDFEPSDDTKPR